MPFLAPLVPALLAAAPAAAATGASIGVGKLLNRPSGAAQDAQQNLADTSAAAKQLALETGKRGMSFLDTAGQTIQQPKDYFRRILSGAPGESTAALAPDIARIRGQNAATTQAVSTLTPRGGGRGETLFNLPYKTTNDVMDLFSTARPNAAAQLADLGVREGALGSSSLGSAGQFIYGAQGGAAQILANELQRRQQEFQTGNALGKTFFDLFKNIKIPSASGATPPFVPSNS